jgi:hypothetical protein
MAEAELDDSRARTSLPPSLRRRRPEAGKRSSLPWIAAAGMGVLALIAVAGSGLLPTSGPRDGSDAAVRPVAGQPARDYAQQLTGTRPPTNPPDAQNDPVADNPDPVAARIARLEAMDSELVQRLAELSQAVELVNGGGLSASMAVRAHEALLLGVVRRRLDRGTPLGPVEAPLARQFALRDPEAVTALLAWSRAPVGVSTLRLRLSEIAAGPDFVGGEMRNGTWGSQVREWLSSLVEIRRSPGEGAVRPTLPDAKEALAERDLARAIAQIERAPAGPRISAWLADARRLAAAEAALDRLELMVLEDPPEMPVESAGTSPPEP